jgi:hypothetical protein
MLSVLKGIGANDFATEKPGSFDGYHLYFLHSSLLFDLSKEYYKY